MDIAPGLFAAGDLRHFHLRVKMQQPQQLAAGVSAAADRMPARITPPPPTCPMT